MCLLINVYYNISSHFSFSFISHSKTDNLFLRLVNGIPKNKCIFYLFLIVKSYKILTVYTVLLNFIRIIIKLYMIVFVNVYKLFYLLHSHINIFVLFLTVYIESLQYLRCTKRLIRR